MNSLIRLLAIMQKEIRQLRRDRLTLGMIIGIPLLQITLFGYAINTDVRYISAGVANQSASQQARWLVADAEASQVIRVIREVNTADQLETLIRKGEISVGLFIPEDFTRRVQDPEHRPAAQLLVDGSDPIILAAARQLLGMEITQRIEAPRPVKTPTFEFRPYFNPERRSALYIVPGLMGVVLTMTMVLFTAVSIVRERERGNLELLINTPVRKSELMVGKITPYVVIGLVQVSIILALGVFLFHLPVNGSVRDVYLAALTFIGANLTMGLFISTLAKNQFQAMQTTFFFFLPSILLSGFMFPFDGMPMLARWIAEGLPLTHFVRLIRGILLRGANITELWTELAALGVFSLIMLSLAITRFRKTLD
ncbi:MAG: ABC transporter permease [Methylococcaceae bacterium]